MIPKSPPRQRIKELAPPILSAPAILTAGRKNEATAAPDIKCVSPFMVFFSSGIKFFFEKF
jgi:hypothetical protein